MISSLLVFILATVIVISLQDDDEICVSGGVLGLALCEVLFTSICVRLYIGIRPEIDIVASQIRNSKDLDLLHDIRLRRFVSFAGFLVHLVRSDSSPHLFPSYTYCQLRSICFIIYTDAFFIS